jgi:hypothetical protein
MRRPIAVCLISLGGWLVGFAGVDAGQKLPARIAHATYVALGYDPGERFLSEREAISDPGAVTPEEREALEDIREAIEKWGRYTIVPDPGQAELWIAVRSGRRAALAVGSSRGGTETSRGGRPTATGRAFGGEVSSPDDTLTVYEAGGMNPLWRAVRGEGLSGSPPALFEEFKTEVERSAKPKR